MIIEVPNRVAPSIVQTAGALSLRAVLLALTSYVIGCLVGAYYITRLRSGADIRAIGSGNAGARNVLRTHDWKTAAATLAFDAGRGALAVVIASILLQEAWAGALAFLFVVTGHIWPAQLGFRGGKGAAPALGCMLALDVNAALLALAGGVVVYLIARSISAGGLTAVAIAPATHAALGARGTSVLTVAAACLLVLLAHHPAVDRSRSPSVTRRRAGES
jgi:glycerol-3-phosphate acyltransferase PlsY